MKRASHRSVQGRGNALGLLTIVGTVGLACGGNSDNSAFTYGGQGTGAAATETLTGSGSSDDDDDTADDTRGTASWGAGTSSTGPDASTGAIGCGLCDAPNEACIDNECVQSCQGQVPDPCAGGSVCNIISGECEEASGACLLSGPSVECGEAQCGPGTVCDGQGECLAIAPCAEVVCLDDGACWGTQCSCERNFSCPVEPEVGTLTTGSFAASISDLEFEDDCTPWMVTSKTGADDVRRFNADGSVDEWQGVESLDLSEIKVRKALTFGARPGPPPSTDVVVTYTCCKTCGCPMTPQQGVARVQPEGALNPLSLVMPAGVTDGDGPFGSPTADAGPQGLSWGDQRLVYVGNRTLNGDLHRVDLDTAMVSPLAAVQNDRVTAAASISPAHLLVGTLSGAVRLYNVNTQSSQPLLQLGAGVTSLSHDAFDGTVYAGLTDLRVVAIRPFEGTMTDFETMPSVGRVTVSPDGQLWFNPVTPSVGSVGSTLQVWPLPSSF